MNCPQCGSTRVRASRERGWNDAFHWILGRRATRCRQCRRRFYTLLSDAPALRGQQKPRGTPRSKNVRRRLIEVAIFGLLLIIFLFFLRYLTRENSPAEESERIPAPQCAVAPV